MKLGYTIIYVADVPKTVAFYEAAFGLTRRFIHDSNLYAEMETGDTVLSFAGNEAAEMSGLAIVPNDPATPAEGSEATFANQLAPHRDYLCSLAMPLGETDETAAMLSRFRLASCVAELTCN